MTDNVIGYRGECNKCPALAYAESLAYVQHWSTNHQSAHSGHAVTVTKVRSYTGPIVKHVLP